MKNNVIKYLFVFLLLGAVSASAQQWQHLGLAGKEILSIETIPANPQHISAGTYYEGLYVSFDGGQNWSNRIATNVSVPFVSYNPWLVNKLFALVGDSYSAGLYTSEDFGDTWNTVNYLPFPRRMSFDPVNPGYIYICFADGIMTSPDYGQNVSFANNGLPGLNILDVKGDGINQSEAYAVGETFVAHTTDFGNNWTDLGGNFGIEDYNPSRIEFEPNGPETLYVACWAFLARSFDRGTNWEFTATTTQDNMAIACDPNEAGILYIGSHGGGVYKSTDAGASFTSINDNLGDLNVHCLEIDSYGNLLAGTDNGVYIYRYIPIPTLSEWGMIILSLLLLAAGTICIIRRRKAVTAKEVR